MMKTIYTFIAAGMMFFITNVQAQVNINTLIIPPASANIYDFNSPAKINVTFTNVSASARLNGYPQVKITGNNGITITSINSPGLYTQSTLNQFIPVSMTTQQLGEVFNVSNLITSGMNDQQQFQFREFGELPDGVYSLCLEMWSNTTGMVKISPPAPNGCANWIIGSGNSYSNSLREPPKPILPACQSIVDDINPQQIVFTWLDPSAFSDLSKGPQEYIIKMVEVEGNKYPFDAIAVNTVIPFFQKTVFGTSYIYNLSDPPLKKGAKYAYVISVKSNNRKYQNNGVSEVCWFTYGATTKADEPAVSKPSKSANPIKGIQYSPLTDFQPIPFNVIKGKLEYAFKKSEESNELSVLSFSETSAMLNNTAVNTNPNAFFPASASTAGSTTPNGNTSYINTNPSLGNITVSESPGIFEGINLANEQNKSTYDKVKEQIASNAGDHKFPLANTKIKISLWVKEAFMKEFAMQKQLFPDGTYNFPPNDIYVGSAVTDKEGNFSVMFSNPNVDLKFYDIELVVENPQFTFPAVPVPLIANETGTYDIGTILGLANTFRLKLKIIGMDGKPVEKATMKVRRATDIYTQKPYLNPEGNRFFDVVKGKTPVDVKSPSTLDEASYEPDKPETPSTDGLILFQLPDFSVPVSSCDKGTCSFIRLFESNGTDEKYVIDITAEGYKHFRTTLEFWPYHNLVFGGASLNSYMNDNMIMQLDATYHLLPEPSKVLGRVVAKENEIPIKDAIILIESDDGKKVYNTTTNAEGKFIVKNITPNPKPYHLTVKGDGITTFYDPDPIFITAEGITIKKEPLYVNAVMIAIAGVVAEVNGPPINAAELRWKNGGKAFYTNETGKFITSNRTGKHVLIIKKPGFREKEITVDVKEKSKKKNETIATVDYGNLTQQFINVFDNNKNTPSSSKVNPLDNFSKQQEFTKSFGYASEPGTGQTENSSAQNFITDNLGYMSPSFPVEVANYMLLDTIFLSKFYVKVTVKDNDNNQPLKDAVVEIPDGDGKFVTDINGVAIVSNVSQGAPTIWVYGPPGKNYIPVSTEVSISTAKDTSEVTIMLKGGAFVSGTVSSNGSGVKDAEVVVLSKEYIKTKTDASGKYAIAVPVGEYTLKAVKSGLVGDAHAQVFEKKDYTIDFELKDPGFNASKLLGFEIVLDSSVAGLNPDEFIISGAFQNIPSNSLFKFPASKKMEFKDITIVKQGDLIYPKSGEVLTSCSQIPLQLWDYLKLVLEKPSGIVVKEQNGDHSKGVIGGDLKVDIAGSFGMGYGLKWPAVPIKLLYKNSPDVPVFTSVPGALNGTDIGLSGQKEGWEIYGVKLSMDFANSSIDNTGISFAGSLNLKGIPGLNNATLTLEELKINTNGNIEKVNINVNPNPELALFGWKLKINAAKINQYGLTFGGLVEIPVPGSDMAKFDFANLGISANSFSGGSFFIPGTGINIFNVINFKGINGIPFAFSKIPSKDAYRITGSGKISFSKFISGSVDLDNFVIGTNGEFGMSVKPNYQVGFADVAELKISSLGLFPSEKKIDVGGSFKLFFPGMGFGAGALVHYKPGNVSVDDLNFSVSAGGIGNLDIKNLKFKENGFEGGGKFEIGGFGGLGMSLKYYKISGKLNIGASFFAPVPIPLGPVTWENPGGGFEINTAASIYDVNVTGRVVLAPGTSGVVALDNIKVGVTAQTGGPKFYGEAYPKVISMTVGKAEFELNVAKKLFYVKAVVGAGFNLIPKLNISGNAGFTLAASAKAGNEYWLAAYYNKVNILGLFDGYTNIAGGWGPKKSEFPAELSFVPDEYVSGDRIYGLHFACASFQGISKDNPKCADDPTGIANVCAYAYNDMKLNFHSNLKSNTYGLGIANKWGAGGSVDFYGIDVGGFNFGVNLALNAGYAGNNWFINGNANANCNGWVGCSSSSCGNGISWGCCFDPCFWDSCEICPCPCGGKICFGIGVSADYSTSTGKFKLGLDW